MTHINKNSSRTQSTTQPQSGTSRRTPLNLHSRVPSPRVSVAESPLNSQQEETNSLLLEAEHTSQSDKKAEQSAKSAKRKRERLAKMSPNEKKEYHARHRIHYMRHKLRKDKSIDPNDIETIIVLKNEGGLKIKDALDVLRMLDEISEFEPLHISHSNKQDIPHDEAEFILNCLNDNKDKNPSKNKARLKDNRNYG